MTLFTRTLLAATIIAGTTLAGVANVQAGCGGSRRSSFLQQYRPRINYAPRQVYHPPAPAPCTQQPIYQPMEQPMEQPIDQPGVPGWQPPAQQAPAQPSQPLASQATPPQFGNTTPTNTAPVNNNPVDNNPVNSAPANSAPANSAQLSALQALAGMTASQNPAAPAPAQPQTSSQVGTWNATLANGARVQLTLQADGSFNWSATNKAGRTSTFGGSYTVAGGNLTLLRSNDNQKLAGAITQSGANTFNFKLAGANDAGLNFVRT